MSNLKLHMRHSLDVQMGLHLDWVERAAALPGKSLHVAVSLLWLVTVRKVFEVRLERATMARFQISRDAAGDGLRRLEAARLIKVNRSPGVSPLVTLIDADEQLLQVRPARRVLAGRP